MAIHRSSITTNLVPRLLPLLEENNNNSNNNNNNNNNNILIGRSWSRDLLKPSRLLINYLGFL
jgi:hypothetical protein